MQNSFFQRFIRNVLLFPLQILMGAFGAGIPTQAKSDFLAGVHLDADTYKCALYVQANATNLNTSATAYGATGGSGSTSTITGEIAIGSNGTLGYTAGGVTVARSATLVNGTKGVAGFANPTFSSLTTPTPAPDAYCIYNSTKSNKIVYIGTLQTVVTGTTANASTAVTGLSTTNGLAVGQAITGAGIPASTTIAAIPSSTTLTLSQNATASATVSLTCGSPLQATAGTGTVTMPTQDATNGIIRFA